MQTPMKVDQWIAQLNDFRHRLAARKQLLKLGPDAVADRLMQLAGNPTARENARWAALGLLGDFHWQPAIPVLLEVMRSSLELRGEACRALATITGQTIGEDVAAWEKALGLVSAESQSAPVGQNLPAEIPPDYRLIEDALRGTQTEIAWEPAGYAYLRCAVAGARTQQVVVTFDTEAKTGQPQFNFYTESGLPNPQAKEIIERRNVTQRFGQFYLEKQADGRLMATLRCLLPKAKATPELLREIVQYLAQEADSLEYEMNHSDTI